MGIKICKFGGTSMADGNVVLASAKIVQADPSRRYVVVSAPGKRFSGDVKVTDLLYQAYESVLEKNLVDFETVFDKIKTRFLSVEKEIGRDLGLQAELDAIKTRMLNGESEDYFASRGEYLSGKIMSAVLDVPFVDATEFIRFDEHGLLDEKTYELGAQVLKKYNRAVIPGFYGLSAKGEVKTFSRGGGDISGAVVARSVRAELYENWTDVSGFYACDPRIVEAPKWIEKLSYQELRELSYMGANVLHSEAIFPVRVAGIPIRICNTFRPEDTGTYILPKVTEISPEQPVTGIAGKKDFTVITIEKSLMNAEIGFTMRLLTVLDRHGISFEHLPSGIDTISLVIDNANLRHGVLDVLVKEIKETVNPDVLSVHTDIALVATVGHGMARNVGTSARLFNALGNAGINVQMIDQGSSELNIIVGVSKDDFANCIKAIYREFFN